MFLLYWGRIFRWFCWKEWWNCNQFCNISEKKNDENDRNFKDHCYYNRKYQGAAHSVCNLKFKEHRYIPLIAHISSGFDNQLVLPNIAEKFKECNFFVLAKTLKSLVIFFA